MERGSRKRGVSVPPWGAADRLLRYFLAQQSAVIRKNEPRARKGSVEGLHDIRVALRRMRSLAMTFEPLDPVFLGRLDRRISKVCDRMGDARDLDVWIGLFREMGEAGGLEEISQKDRRGVLAALRRERTHLASAALEHGLFQRVKKMIRDYLRRLKPKLKGGGPVAEALAARRMLAVRGLIEKRHRKVGSFSCGPAHDLRRAGRRMRYLSEFYAEHLGVECERAGRWITKAQAALGKVHDCDNALALSQSLPTSRARAAVRRGLRKRRAEQLRKFKIAWRQYADPRLQKAWQKRLEAWAEA